MSLARNPWPGIPGQEPFFLPGLGDSPNATMSVAMLAQSCSAVRGHGPGTSGIVKSLALNHHSGIASPGPVNGSASDPLGMSELPRVSCRIAMLGPGPGPVKLARVSYGIAIPGPIRLTR